MVYINLQLFLLLDFVNIPKFYSLNFKILHKKGPKMGPNLSIGSINYANETLLAASTTTAPTVSDSDAERLVGSM